MQQQAQQQYQQQQQQQQATLSNKTGQVTTTTAHGQSNTYQSTQQRNQTWSALVDAEKPKQAFNREVYTLSYRSTGTGLDAQFPRASLRPQTPPIVRPSLEPYQQLSAENFGKESITRRLPARVRMRYMLPGYQGAVHKSQSVFGQTFGRTTRACICGDGEVANK
jgi:hypothetical protein